MSSSRPEPSRSRKRTGRYKNIEKFVKESDTASGYAYVRCYRIGGVWHASLVRTNKTIDHGWLNEFVVRRTSAATLEEALTLLDRIMGDRGVEIAPF